MKELMGRDLLPTLIEALASVARDSCEDRKLPTR